MKATIESTTQIVDMGGVKARVWEGVTEKGIPFTAYISMCQVRSNADNFEFERDLKEQKEPSPETAMAIALR